MPCADLYKIDGEPRLVHIPITKENAIKQDYIFSGHRKNYNTVGRVVKSLFERHNETFNVWTHLLTMNFFVVMVVYILSTNTELFYFGKRTQFDFENFSSFKNYLQEIKNNLPKMNVPEYFSFFVYLLDRNEWNRYIQGGKETYNIKIDLSLKTLTKQISHFADNLKDVDVNYNLIRTLRAIKSIPMVI